MLTTINDFKKIFEQKQTGIIYHFTDIFSLKDITNNWSNHTPSLNFSDDDFFDDNSKFISTSRKKDFIWGPIRFTLDGNKISNNYKIVPVSYFSKKTNDVNTDPNQYEERIIGKNNDKLSLLKYCIQVDICMDPKYDYYSDEGEGDDLISHQDDVDHAYSYFTELKIPINITDSFNSVKY